MSPYQEEKDGIVSLTDAGVKEIQAQKNFYSDATKPIPREKRDWHTKDMANLWIGIIVSVAVYQVASGLLVAGMTWYEALITIVLGHTLVMAGRHDYRSLWRQIRHELRHAGQGHFWPEWIVRAGYHPWHPRHFLVRCPGMDRRPGYEHYYFYCFSCLGRPGISGTLYLLSHLLGTQRLHCRFGQ